MFRKFTNVFLFLLLLSISAYGQTAVKITLTPYGVTPFMVALSTTDIYDFTYTGLKNVGVGTKVYLEAAITGKKFGTVTYTFTRKPSGAKAAIGTTKEIKNDSTQIVFFTADLPGTYAFKVTDGVYTTTTDLVINAAKYLGYKNTVVNGVDTKLSCNTCHSTYVAGWEKTNHASLFSRAMVATPGISSPTDHYSVSCIKCHTTGYDANPTAINDGFDDLGFVYPTVVTPTTLAELTVKYPAAIMRGNIQCESCHGPAGAHVGNTSDNRMVATFEPEVCAYCHESGTNHIIAREFRAAAHATNSLDGEVIDESGAGREACVRCHTGKGFVQFTKNISTTDPYFDPSFYPITCAGCHDPHGLNNEKQLRKLTATLVYPSGTTPATATTIEVKGAGLGTLCFNCHQSRTEAKTALAGVGTTSISNRFGPHYGAQGDILYSNNMLELGGNKLASTNHFGVTGNSCVTCHMYSLNRIDADKNLIRSGGHSFGVREPHPVGADGHILKDAVGDLIKGKANMEACSQCHGLTLGNDFADVKFFYKGIGDNDNDGVVEGLQDEVKGMVVKVMTSLRDAIPGVVLSTSYGYNTATGWFGFPTPSKTWTTTQLSAYWNAFTAVEDRSGGIHNPKYVITALRGAMASLGIATAVEAEMEVPTAYTLYQNYPNPFNPTTNIKFALPKSGHIKLTIYDALGKEVETLVNSDLAAGSHNIEWTARNMASGIYLYRIEAGNFVKVNKMLLVK